MAIEYMESLVKESESPGQSPSPSIDSGSSVGHEDSEQAIPDTDNGGQPRGEKIMLLDQRDVDGEVEYLVAEMVQECTYAAYQGFRGEGYKIKRTPVWRTKGGAKMATVYWARSWINAKHLDFQP